MFRGLARSVSASVAFRRSAAASQTVTTAVAAAAAARPAHLDVGWWSVGQHRALSAEASAPAHAATDAPIVARRARKVNHRLGIPESQPDIVKKFINCTMKHGKKSTAQRIFNDAMAELKVQELARIRKEAEVAAAKALKAGAESEAPSAIEHAQQENVDPTAMFVEALNTLMPVIGTLGIKRGGTVYQVPIALSPKRRQQYAIKWMIQACRSRKGRPMAQKIALEVMDVLNLEGTAYNKKTELHKIAEANRAYANLR